MYVVCTYIDIDDFQIASVTEKDQRITVVIKMENVRVRLTSMEINVTNAGLVFSDFPIHAGIAVFNQ